MQGSQILAVETRKDGRNITLQLDAGSEIASAGLAYNSRKNSESPTKPLEAEGEEQQTVAKDCIVSSFDYDSTLEQHNVAKMDSLDSAAKPLVQVIPAQHVQPKEELRGSNLHDHREKSDSRISRHYVAQSPDLSSKGVLSIPRNQNSDEQRKNLAKLKNRLQRKKTSSELKQKLPNKLPRTPDKHGKVPRPNQLDEESLSFDSDRNQEESMQELQAKRFK